MQTQYFKEHSCFLKRDMEFKVYGHCGQPCLAFACEGGRFYDWEDHGMIDALSPLIESGKIQVFCADSVDSESWMGQQDDRERTETQERWFNYLCSELVPRILEINAEDGKPYETVLPMGISLGACHAITLYLRRPELFCGAVGLSGSYLPSGWFGHYTDDLVLRNSPLDLLRLTSASRAKNFNGPLWLCCGQGAYEERFLAETNELVNALNKHKIPVQLELWGDDSCHDWNWWKKQLPLFVQRCLDVL